MDLNAGRIIFMRPQPRLNQTEAVFALRILSVGKHDDTVTDGIPVGFPLFLELVVCHQYRVIKRGVATSGGGANFLN